MSEGLLFQSKWDIIQQKFIFHRQVLGLLPPYYGKFCSDMEQIQFGQAATGGVL